LRPHRQTPVPRASEIDLHDDGCRPGQALAHAKEGVGYEYPIPTWSPHQEEGDGRCNQPAGDENVLPTETIGELTSGVVGERLCHPEDNDEGENRRAGEKMKILLGDGR